MAGDDTSSIRIENPIELLRKTDREMIYDLSGQIIGMSKVIENLDTRFNEFIKEQKEINKAILTNCNREERWGTFRGELSACKGDYCSLDTRVEKIERAKCPKLPVLEDLDTRVTSLESIKTVDESVKKANRSNLEYVLFFINVMQGVIIIWQALKPGT